MQRFVKERSKKILAGSSLVKQTPLSPLLLLLIFLIATFVFSLRCTWTVASTIASVSAKRLKLEARLNCWNGNETRCSKEEDDSYPVFETEAEAAVCPEYFRWIEEDLRAWKERGISREMVERGRESAHFRLVVKKGRVYVERYKKSIQTRDVFTMWAFLQLLRRYPGRVPDLELMFDCDDLPVIRPRQYHPGPKPNVSGPPPLFRYCGDRWTEDIVFPDWSFWGWAEINIRPWEQMLKEIENGNRRIKWNDREPYAYWKGNPFVAETRQDLLKCNVSSTQDWNARLFVQDWIQESQQGFNKSNLASQCTHRYKIYIEGYAWSVSEKYILACDSVTLLVKPRFYDFFIRSLQPTQHYWPIRDKDKCKSIKHAVDWGNSHKQEAEKIGKAASKFIQEELKMDYVYDYMFHLLSEYAKLLRFEARVPEGAEELCVESMACRRNGLEKKFMIESMVKEPSTKAPCSLPPPFHPTSLRLFNANKLNLIRRVERWEDNYWKNTTYHH
ncbi:hypothetical protein VNO78_07767 [Psophocarpus tetragonolobus]|uniref:Glycosyl transferase CAP10 domain-containing protein n=1 Tax=Psophocarpus tetragonolobus TaxID=3891 RepID=A0AAN9XRZ3_PSOTE